MKCFPLSHHSNEMCDEKIPGAEKHMGIQSPGEGLKNFINFLRKIQGIFDSIDFPLIGLAPKYFSLNFEKSIMLNPFTTKTL